MRTQDIFESRSKSPQCFSTLVVEKCCRYQLSGKVRGLYSPECRNKVFLVSVDRVSAIYRLNEVTIPCYIN